MNRDALHISFSGLGRAAPRVVRTSLAKPDMPQGLMGKQLLFISDVHMGWMYPERAVLRLREQIRAIAPDLILWGGDLAESRTALHRFLDLVSGLRPPMGMFSAVGNNDVEHEPVAALLGAAGAAGIRLLVNECARIQVAGGSLLILGMDEPKHGTPDMNLLTTRAEPSELRILLLHSPSALQEMPDDLAAPPDLILCGHTHGGQLCAFGLNPYTVGYEGGLHRKNFFVTGEHQLGAARLIVSNGVGTTALPLRVGAPPQLHLVSFTNEKNG